MLQVTSFFTTAFLVLLYCPFQQKPKQTFKCVIRMLFVNMTNSHFLLDCLKQLDFCLHVLFTVTNFFFFFHPVIDPKVQ